jgi:CBS domain containing-hemolysin-like protein
MVELWIAAIILAGLIALSGFFSGLEVALVGVRKSKVIQLLNEGKKGSKALHKLKTNPSWMMSSVNLGNNLVNVGASALATSVAIQLFGDDGLGIAIGIMTFLILVFGEITPKTYCNANSAKIALRFAPILLGFSYVFYPVVKFFEIITKGVVKITGSSYVPPPITEEEIKGVIDQGLAEKALEKDEMELVHGALKFDDTVIRSVMTPRTKMFTLNSKTLLFEALPQINQNGFSRIPIYGTSKDDIVGFVHVRDVLKELEKDNKMRSMEQIARKPVFVSQEKMVSALLKEMKGRKTHMAIVVDEHGGVEGLIITNGEIEIDKINEIFKTNVPEGDDYASLNGLLHEKLQDIPQAGDKIEVDDLRIVVEKVLKNVPQKIRIEKIKA